MKINNTIIKLLNQSLLGEQNFPIIYNRLKFGNNIGIFCLDLYGHYGCVNAVEFSRDGGRYLASGGDDKRIFIWNVKKTFALDDEPLILSAAHNSNIFCLAFDSQTSSLFSSGNDEQVIHHDLNKNTAKNVFLYDDAIYGLSVDPFNDNIFCVACEDGQVLMTDARTIKDSVRVASYTSPFHSVMHHPIENNYLITANTKEGIGLWDIRKPGSCLFRYRSKKPIILPALPKLDKVNTFSSYNNHLDEQDEDNVMSAKFNSDGSLVMALFRRLGPQLYPSNHDILKRGHGHSFKSDEVDKENPLMPICKFDHPTYYNSCTMKSGCFAGDKDQYIVSGSDDFNVYIWKIPDGVLSLNFDIHASTYHLPYYIMKGHRSIVNQTRFEPNQNLLVSSGVEKIIKIWSPNAIGLKDKTLLKIGPNVKNIFASSDKKMCKDFVICDKDFMATSCQKNESDIIIDNSHSLDTGIYSALNLDLTNNREPISLEADNEAVNTSNEVHDENTLGENEAILMYPRSLLTSYDTAEPSVEEDTGMLAFFDSLLQHELEGWDSDLGSTSSSFSSLSSCDEEISITSASTSPKLNQTYNANKYSSDSYKANLTNKSFKKDNLPNTNCNSPSQISFYECTEREEHPPSPVIQPSTSSIKKPSAFKRFLKPRGERGNIFKKCRKNYDFISSISPSSSFSSSSFDASSPFVSNTVYKNDTDLLAPALEKNVCSNSTFIGPLFKMEGHSHYDKHSIVEVLSIPENLEIDKNKTNQGKNHRIAIGANNNNRLKRENPDYRLDAINDGFDFYLTFYSHFEAGCRLFNNENDTNQQYRISIYNNSVNHLEMPKPKKELFDSCTIKRPLLEIVHNNVKQIKTSEDHINKNNCDNFSNNITVDKTFILENNSKIDCNINNNHAYIPWDSEIPPLCQSKLSKLILEKKAKEKINKNRPYLTVHSKRRRYGNNQQTNKELPTNNSHKLLNDKNKMVSSYNESEHSESEEFNFKNYITRSGENIGQIIIGKNDSIDNFSKYNQSHDSDENYGITSQQHSLKNGKERLLRKIKMLKALEDKESNNIIFEPDSKSYPNISNT
ncbi:putative uncharacterized protein DDB_G0277255 isoform X2 [Gordionus sp. m RMFG-2023]|uniref:putative uncharacterized protein DDB_G0277255 isoform X2 n=1 Tax=Gordionus sp. m RMFG-2023 TaxID=3053472 RepID=UPI0031FD2782